MVYRRKFKHSKEELLEEGKKIIAADRDAKFLFRVAMVNLVLSGMTSSELSNYCGVDERTISGWVAKVDDDGFDSLRAVKQTGRPSKLSNDQKEKIKYAILKNPSEYGYSNWDGPSLSDFILKEFGVEFSVRACQKLMHELGFSLIRPQTYPSLGESDEGARDRFRREIAAAYNDPSKILVFQDEVHFTIQTTVTRKWTLRGSEPRVKSYPGRKNISYSGFVITKTGQLWVDKPEWFNFETVISSLRKFLSACPPADGKKYCIILDNAPWHKKARRLIRENKDGEFDDILGKAEFVSLPPYSPDLNPIEQVWRITRKNRTHNRFFGTLEELQSAIDGFFTGLLKPNRMLRNLCTFNWMKKMEGTVTS